MSSQNKIARWFLCRGFYNEAHAMIQSDRISQRMWQPAQSELTRNLLGVGEETSDDMVSRDTLLNAENFVLESPTERLILTEHALVDLSSNKVRPLGITSLHDVPSHVNSCYTGCRDDVKFIVGAMSIKSKHLVFEGVNNLSKMTIEAETATQESVMSVAKAIICQYQKVWWVRIQWNYSSEDQHTEQ